MCVTKNQCTVTKTHAQLSPFFSLGSYCPLEAVRKLQKLMHSWLWSGVRAAGQSQAKIDFRKSG